MNAEKRKREFKKCVRLLIWSAPDASKLRCFREGHEVIAGSNLLSETGLRLSSFGPTRAVSADGRDDCG
jgi:hypothetical protein